MADLFHITQTIRNRTLYLSRTTGLSFTTGKEDTPSFLTSLQPPAPLTLEEAASILKAFKGIVNGKGWKATPA